MVSYTFIVVTAIMFLTLRIISLTSKCHWTLPATALRSSRYSSNFTSTAIATDSSTDAAGVARSRDVCCDSLPSNELLLLTLTYHID